MKNRLIKVLGLVFAFCFVLTFAVACSGECEHNILSDWIVDKPATCAEVGLQRKECMKCKTIMEMEKTSKLEHVSNEWIEYRPASCEEDGLKYKKCTVCKYDFDFMQIPATGHTFVSGVCACGVKYYTQGLVFQKLSGGEYALSGLGLAEDIDIIIPSTYKGLPVTKIYDEAFNSNDDRCQEIRSVTIPKSVTSVSSGAFIHSYLSIIYCEAESKPMGWGSNWNASLCPVVWNCKNNDIADNGCIYVWGANGLLYRIKDNLTTVIRHSIKTSKVITIAEEIIYKNTRYKVTGIGDMAFYNCDTLISVVIPNSIKSIGNRAFASCDSLINMIIPDSVTSMGWYVFLDCYSLTIYCEAESKPSDWHSEWNVLKCPVFWDYKV